MRARPRDPDFNVKEYLAEHPRDKVKPWGRAIINIDLNKLFCCSRGSQKNNEVADAQQRSVTLKAHTTPPLPNDKDFDFPHSNIPNSERKLLPGSNN